MGFSVSDDFICADVNRFAHDVSGTLLLSLTCLSVYNSNGVVHQECIKLEFHLQYKGMCKDVKVVID